MAPTAPLGACEAMVFIAYSVPADAEERGYSDWLRRVDNPFFNGRDGMGNYQNWRLPSDTDLPWDYFDFMGVTRMSDLEKVWHDPGLDTFRKEWLRLWGYGRDDGPRPAHLAYSYLFEPVHCACTTLPTEVAFTTGTGPAPRDGLMSWQRTGFLPKHFAEGADSDTGTDWLLKTVADDPLGFDWIRVDAAPAPGLTATLIAAPDTEVTP